MAKLDSECFMTIEEAGKGRAPTRDVRARIASEGLLYHAALVPSRPCGRAANRSGHWAAAPAPRGAVIAQPYEHRRGAGEQYHDPRDVKRRHQRNPQVEHLRG